MHASLASCYASISAGVVAWLMVRLGTSKRALVVKTRPRCAACGRRRTGRVCRCSE